MNQLSDELLIEFCQGKPHAFQAVFDSFRMRIFYFVRNLIDDSPAAEEITSDTFIKLHRLHDKFSTYNNIQAFLFITARNASLNYLKHRQRQRLNRVELEGHKQQESEIPLYATTDIEAGVLAFIYDEIEKLPPRSKQIFKLFYLEGHSINNIAVLLMIKRSTVISLKDRALKQLRMKVLDKPGLLLALLYLSGRNALFEKIINSI